MNFYDFVDWKMVFGGYELAGLIIVAIISYDMGSIFGLDFGILPGLPFGVILGICLFITKIDRLVHYFARAIRRFLKKGFLWGIEEAMRFTDKESLKIGFERLERGNVRIENTHVFVYLITASAAVALFIWIALRFLMINMYLLLFPIQGSLIQRSFGLNAVILLVIPLIIFFALALVSENYIYKKFYSMLARVSPLILKRK